MQFRKNRIGEAKLLDSIFSEYPLLLIKTMPMFNPEELIFTQKLKSEEIFEESLKHTDAIDKLIAGLGHAKPKIRYTSSKIIILYSAQNPDLLYPYFDRIVVYLSDFSSILQWNTMSVLANLAKIDSQNKINRSVINRLFDLLSDESMITSGNAVLCLGYIAAEKPQFTDLIVEKILEVSDYPRKTAECSRIINGHIITALGNAYAQSDLKKKIEKFIESQLESERSGTATKARLFFKKQQKGLL